MRPVDVRGRKVHYRGHAEERPGGVNLPGLSGSVLMTPGSRPRALFYPRDTPYSKPSRCSSVAVPWHGAHRLPKGAGEGFVRSGGGGEGVTGCPSESLTGLRWHIYSNDDTDSDGIHSTLDRDQGSGLGHAL